MQDVITCHYCQVELSPWEMTKDHIVPRSIGGLDIRWNIVWSCRDCNSKKADTYPTCPCAKCSRTRRRHWELEGIPNPKRNKVKA